MDEPFGALDALTRETMTLELLRLWYEDPKTIVFVTHSISEAVMLGHRVVVMSPRPGQVKQVLDINLPSQRDFSLVGTPDFIRCTALVRELIFEHEVA
jgi:NitT/TauT family transport system ATP-binding protein